MVICEAGEKAQKAHNVLESQEKRFKEKERNGQLKEAERHKKRGLRIGH